MTTLFFTNALLPGGWAKDVRINVDNAGWISSITVDAGAHHSAADAHIALPGMPNLHSHAFQRAMAGLAEIKSSDGDSFWTWRQAMYRFVEQVTPDDLLAISTQLYCEMLEAGFTSVAEFHYLHHDQTGKPYGDIGEMTKAIAGAANETGIGLTMLPVFYANSGVGGKPPAEGQRRFINSPDSYEKLFARAEDILKSLPDAAVGITPHSLRAVTPQSLNQVLSLSEKCPVHIHIAEQIKEVDELLSWSGQRPVEWLLDHANVDQRWCLIHATHLTAAERQGIAHRNAVVGLCPITEANLGDGIFDGVNYLGEGGQFGIGSDSNVRISVAEELRSLEYSQRLRDQGRNLLVTDGSTGRSLFDNAVRGGAQASGRKIGKLEVGYRADIITLDDSNPTLIGRSGDEWLDSWIFAGDNQVVSDVWVGGKHMVINGNHTSRDHARISFKKTIERITAT
jgi:formimidoylglutamate deiminase